MHRSIREMNYSMDLRQQLLEVQLKGRLVVTTSTPPIKRAPATLIEDYESKIHNERVFISKYKCGYRQKAVEAYGRIKWYRNRIAELKEQQS